MAMTVMTIGASAVMSMQKASVQGNSDARQADIANSIARMWVERLQRDAMQWTLPNGANPQLNNFANAQLLSTQLASAQAGKWGVPKAYMGVTNPETMSYGFDVVGRDLPSAQIAAEAQFCVSYRLQWLVPQSLAANEPGLIRADVRVLWPRGVANAPPSGWCADGSAATASDNPDPSSPSMYHAIYLSTSIRENAQ